MFEVNQKIKCINNDFPHQQMLLTKNDIYTVTYVAGPFVYLKEIPNKAFREDRFDSLNWWNRLGIWFRSFIYGE